MGKWLDLAEREDMPRRVDSVFSADWSRSAPNDTKDPNGMLRQSPEALLWVCAAGLGRLDPLAPLHGHEPQRWRGLLDDAQWVLDSFAPAAFRNGWSVADLFGLWWWDDTGMLTLKDAWGGVSDRLQGARSLVMDGHRASWRRMFTQEPDVFARGTYPDLLPLWETGR